MSEGTIDIVSTLHWKGLRETIGEMEIEEESWWLLSLLGHGWRCLPFYSYFLVNVTANLIIGSYL